MDVVNLPPSLSLSLGQLHLREAKMSTCFARLFLPSQLRFELYPDIP